MSVGDMTAQDNSVILIRRGLDLLFAVIKKHAFYPEGNEALHQSFQAFHEWLAAFLGERGILRIDVEKNQLLHQGQVVQQERPGERAMIFPL